MMQCRYLEFLETLPLLLETRVQNVKIFNLTISTILLKVKVAQADWLN